MRRDALVWTRRFLLPALLLHATVVWADQPTVSLDVTPSALNAHDEKPVVFHLRLQNTGKDTIRFGASRGAFSSGYQTGYGAMEFGTHITDENGDNPVPIAPLQPSAGYIVDLASGDSLGSEIDINSLYRLKSGHTYTVQFSWTHKVFVLPGHDDKEVFVSANPATVQVSGLSYIAAEISFHAEVLYARLSDWVSTKIASHQISEYR